MPSWDFDIVMGVEHVYEDCIYCSKVNITVGEISVCYSIFENKESV